ncbi:unnamed protein product [Effrenium voratum]|nr:unnamed protein product [Effrenium voratum]
MQEVHAAGEAASPAPDLETVRAIRAAFVEVLSEQLRELELRLERKWRARAEGKLGHAASGTLEILRGRSGTEDLDHPGSLPSLLSRQQSPPDDSRSVSKDTAAGDEANSMENVPSLQSTFSKKRRLSAMTRAGDVAHREYARSFRSSTTSQEKTRLTPMQRVLRSKVVEMTLAFTILASSVLVGIEVQMMSDSLDMSLPPALVTLRIVLNISFVVELLVRLYAFGFSCRRQGGIAWFAFDVLVVCGSAAEAALDVYGILVKQLDAIPDFSQVRLLKILRVTRLVRAFRVPYLMKYFGPLQTLVSSISHTLWYLVWAAVLLLLLIYTVSIAFAQTVSLFIINEGLEQVEEKHPALLEFWRDLWTSMITCFMAISGGLNWKIVYDPLNELDALMGNIFVFFISFAYFALLNILTGVFCNSAMEALSRDPDIVAISQDAIHAREHLCGLFSSIDVDDSGHLTLDEVEVWMSEGNGKVDLQAMGIDEGDPWVFFKLLDENAQGYVTQEAFVDGCLRLRGGASGVDMASLRNESRAMHELLAMLFQRVESLDSKQPRRPSRALLGSKRFRRHTVGGMDTVVDSKYAEDLTM